MRLYLWGYVLRLSHKLNTTLSDDVFLFPTGVSFLARLSGSTAEFLSMWALMMAGEAPFVMTPDDAGKSQTLSVTAWLCIICA